MQITDNQIKLVIYDLNKTLIKDNSWYDLNIAMGITDQEDQMLLNFYQDGIINYHDWLRIIKNIYINRGTLKKYQIEKILHNYTYNEGAHESIKYLKNKGYKIGLISGAMDILVEKVAQEAKIDWWAANNSMHFDKQGNLKNITIIDEDENAKLTLLKQMCQEQNIALHQTVCIGDGDNDILLFKATNRGITFKDSKIEKFAWKTINSLHDINQIL